MTVSSPTLSLGHSDKIPRALQYCAEHVDCQKKMNTLTGIEAERVNQILKHAVDRLQILSFIPIVWDDDIVVDIKSPAVLNSLEKLWMAEEQLKELDSSQNGMKDIQLVKTTHRAVRACCRNFIADRASLQVVMTRPESQSDDFTKYIKYLIELKSQVLQRLTTTVEDEIANRNMLHDLTERERSCLAMKEELDKQTQDLKEEKAQVSFGLDNTLRKLQQELAEITQHNNIELDSVAKEMNEAINKATADHELRMRQLQDRVDSMDRTVNEVVEKNKEEEQRLRREKTRMENTLNAKIAQYDEDMLARTNQLKELNDQYAAEAKEYAALKAHFDRIDADLGRQDEEAALLEAVARREAYGKWVVDHAATMIIKIVRGRHGRKTVAAIKAKSKKGKKGKKGK